MNRKLVYVFMILGGLLALSACSDRPSQGATPEQQFVISAENAQSIAALKVAGTCSLENIITVADNSKNDGAENTYKVKKDVAYKLVGFATNVAASTVPKSIRIILVGDDSYSKETTTGLDRPDVVTFFKNPSLTGAGYQLDAGFGNVKPGEYTVFIIDTNSPEKIACPTHQKIFVN